MDNLSNPVILNGHNEEVSGAAFSTASDLDKLLTWSEDGTTIIWDTRGNKLQTLENHRGPILSAIFSPNGNNILTRGQDSLVMVWDSNGQLLSPGGIDHEAYVYTAKFAPDSKTILIGCANGKGGIYSLEGRLIEPFSGHGNSSIKVIDISANGKNILTADESGLLILRDNTGKPIEAPIENGNGIINAAFSPDGNLLFAATKHSIKLWRNFKEEPSKFKSLPGHSDNIISVDFLPTGEYLVSSSLDGTSKFWDYDGDLIINYQGKENLFTRAIFSKENGDLLFVNQDYPMIFCPNPKVVYDDMKAKDPDPEELEEFLKGFNN